MNWLSKHFNKIALGFVALIAVAVVGSYTDNNATAQSAYVQPSAVASQTTAVVAPVPPVSYANVAPAATPNGTYTNIDGNSVPRPYYADTAPAGATAQCRDGSYSFSQHRSGTCSHHGGVSEWL